MMHSFLFARGIIWDRTEDEASQIHFKSLLILEED